MPRAACQGLVAALLVSVVLLIGVDSALAQAVKPPPPPPVVPTAGCEVLVWFFNAGPPGRPAADGDPRFGVRLAMTDVAVVLTPDERGFVRFYLPRDTSTTFTVVPLYLPPDSYDPFAASDAFEHQAHCGLNAVQVPFGA